MTSSCSSYPLYNAATSTGSLATLFRIIPASVICSFLDIADVLALASVNHAPRQLILSSPAVWRTKEFPVLPLPPSFTPSLSTDSPSTWNSVVQVVNQRSWWHIFHTEEPREWPLTFVASLLLYPNLRRIHASDTDLFRYGRGSQQQTAPSPHQPVSTSSLSSMRYLTGLSLCNVDQMTVDDMRLLATLPALVSFSAAQMEFQYGNKHTLRLWQALTSNSQQRKGKGKVDQLAAAGDGEDEAEAVDAADDVKEGKDDEGDDEEESDDSEKDSSLPQKNSAFLLFLHALASKPSLVHLELVNCGFTRSHFDHMPVWPHLLSIDLYANDDDEFCCYDFGNAVERFPSLTSLSVSNCSDAAITHLVRLPVLEELRFHNYLCAEVDVVEGFRTLSEASKPRAIYFSGFVGGEDDFPYTSRHALDSLHSLPHLTRLSISAGWRKGRLLTDHFQHLRCLELIAHYGSWYCQNAQADELWMPLVKPLHVQVDGRQQRQTRRAAKRRADYQKSCGEPLSRDAEDGDVARGAEEEAEVAGERVIPANNAANFPSLECLELPSQYYSHVDGDDKVSRWMIAQLRRSYEYEVAAEWEAECTTLGLAELLKSIMA